MKTTELIIFVSIVAFFFVSGGAIGQERSWSKVEGKSADFRYDQSADVLCNLGVVIDVTPSVSCERGRVYVSIKINVFGEITLDWADILFAAGEFGKERKYDQICNADFGFNFARLSGEPLDAIELESDRFQVGIRKKTEVPVSKLITAKALFLTIKTDRFPDQSMYVSLKGVPGLLDGERTRCGF